MSDIIDTSTGVIVGANEDRLVGFHGVQGSTLRASADQDALDDTPIAEADGEAPTAGEFDAAVAQINALTVLVNELRAALVEKGLIKGEA
jgi:hypothetical protein